MGSRQRDQSTLSVTKQAIDIGMRYFASGWHVLQRGYKRQQVHCINSCFHWGAEPVTRQLSCGWRDVMSPFPPSGSYSLSYRKEQEAYKGHWRGQLLWSFGRDPISSVTDVSRSDQLKENLYVTKTFPFSRSLRNTLVTYEMGSLPKLHRSCPLQNLN